MTTRNESICCTAVAVLWILITVILVNCAGAIIVDGFQSLGGIANSSRPGDLHWPMMGSFMGYDHAWGFHWPGWPLLRSLLLPLLPWNPLIELSLLSMIWAATAWIGMCLVDRKSESRMKFWVALLTLTAPGFLVAAQSYRPEIVTAFGLVVALRYWRSCEKMAKVWRVAALIFLPLLHPLGLIVPVAWCGWELLWNIREHRLVKALLELTRKAWPIGLGVIALTSWFALQPEAWAQFQMNVESQRLLVAGMGTGWRTFFVWGLGSKSALPLVALLLGALVISVLLPLRFFKNRQDSCNSIQCYAAVGLWTAVLFNIAAKNPNSLHLVAVIPLAVLLFVEGIAQIVKVMIPIGVRLAMAATLLVFLAYPIKLSYSFYRNNGQSYRGALVQLLAQLPDARKVLIPVAFWEAAQLKGRSNQTIYQFSTFPNILKQTERARYEGGVIAELQQGDLLIWDPLQEQGGVFNFVETTALRHQLIHPQGAAQWERLADLNVPVRYSRNQSVCFEVYRKR